MKRVYAVSITRGEPLPLVHEDVRYFIHADLATSRARGRYIYWKRRLKHMIISNLFRS